MSSKRHKPARSELVRMMAEKIADKRLTRTDPVSGQTYTVRRHPDPGF